MLHLPTLTPLEHASFVTAGLLVYVVVTRIRRQRRHPYSAVAWVMAIAAFPYLGVPLFLLFGTRKTVRPPSRASAQAVAPPLPPPALAPRWATQVLAALDAAPPQRAAPAQFDAEGAAAYATLLALMGSARQTLDVATFVLGDDEVGDGVTQALAERARAGVRVRLMIDGVGSLKTLGRHDAALKAAGVQVGYFMPLRWPRIRARTNLRNHRKSVVVDGSTLWCGGRNLAREYFLPSHGQPAWADLSFVVHGPLAADAAATFAADWRLARPSRLEPLALDDDWPASGLHAPRVAVSAIERATAATQAASVAAAALEPPAAAWPCALPAGTALAQWVRSGPDGHGDALHALLVTAAFHAQQRILAATPYFVPDEDLINAWVLACRRGVRLTLVLPAQSNHRLADLARGRALRDLIDAGANVRLTPYMLHAKAVVVDQALALCGSLNLDSRSLFINYEAMVAFYGAADIDWLAAWIEGRAAPCPAASGQPPSWGRDVLEGVVRTVGFQL